MPKKRLSKSSLLWFIRSRSYVSIPDIRRRFNLEEGDEVSVIAGGHGRLFVGLPADAARVLGDLLREGRVGLETEPGLLARAVVGAYVIPQNQNVYEHPGVDFGSPSEPEAGGESAIVP